ncbi:scoloptoxin SSD14-like isoform X3 [Gordionus sp. m RMFG-2023]|uniref:scoloptoxin SSD14-like isoform X3 n=1 Tax=Gordionus sp. m RMFG-2023 TaxID=3053472 RepID=UPI0031FCB2DA
MGDMENLSRKKYFTRRKYLKMIRYLLLVCRSAVFLVLTLSITLNHYDSRTGTWKDLTPNHGAVTSDVKLCSDIGVQQMKKGGSSIDAIVATIFCKGVVNGAHSGIGGLTWKDNVEPAMKLAENGFPITKATYRALVKEFESPSQLERDFPQIASLYLSKISNATDFSNSTNRTVQYLEVRSLIKNLALAKVLRRIANEGPAAIYEGSIAEHIVEAVNANGGAMTLQDLRDYQPKMRNAFETSFLKGRYTILSCPPPASGPILGLIFKLLERFGAFDMVNASQITPFLAQFYDNTLSCTIPCDRAEDKSSWVMSMNCGDNRTCDDPRSTNSNPKADRSRRQIVIDLKNGNNILVRIPTKHDNNSTSSFIDTCTQYPYYSETDLRHFPIHPFFENAPNLSLDQLTMFYHWVIESFKLASVYSNYVGDPGPEYSPYSDNDVSTNSNTDDNKILYMVQSMFESSNLDLLANKVSNERSNNKYSQEVYGSNGTAHASAIDKNDLIVSVTTSINNSFGSKVISHDGILLNDHLDGFTKDINSFNYPAPGKRPHTSMVPTIAYDRLADCGYKIALGGSNGTRIISGVTQVLMYVLAFGDTLETAMARPRLYFNPQTDIIEVEENFPNLILRGLEKKNHKFLKVEGLNSVLPLIKFQNKIFASSDPRKSPIQSAAIF